MAGTRDGAHGREDLERLDAALGRIRRLWDRPEVRRWFQHELDLGEIDAALYRTLRAVRVTTASGQAPSVGSVAGVLHVDPSTASRFVDRAVAAGFVQRSSSAADRRRTTLELTSSGEERLASLRAVRVRFLGELTESWPRPDLHRFTELLEAFDALADGWDATDG